MSERTLYESPEIWSWWTARSSNFDSGTGIFTDRGPRGNNWIQATAGNLPSLVTNWKGTGLDARSFDNTDDWIDASHNGPLGCFSAVILGEIDTGWSAGDNADKVWLGTQSGTGTSQQFRFTGVNRKLRVDSQGTSSAQTAALTQNVAKVITFVIDPTNKEMACRFDGGSWTSVALPVAGIPVLKQYEIGARAGNGATRTAFMRAPVAEIIIFQCSLKEARFASLLSDAEHTLATMGGVTIP